MKHLVLVRHAKSSWKDEEIEDHERPLSKRGERDAPFMAKIFRDKKLRTDLIISSTAVRALATAGEFARALDIKKKKILRVSEMYLADAEDILDYIQQLDDDYKSVMIFGHNPGLSILANDLTDGSIGDLPTCAIVAIDFDTSTWKEARKGTGKLRFFEFPGKYFNEAGDS
jgi:phosphohistidine phosphatase